MMRKAGFTLIELLVVISILVLLMGILMPAILKARDVVIATRAKAQVKAMVDACRAYAAVFNGSAPAVFGDLPDTGGNPAKLSGCQSLKLALMGCSVSGSSVWSQDEVATNFEDYSGSAHKAPFYTPNQHDNEMRSHGDPKIYKNPSHDGGYGNFGVFTDYMYSPAKPVLYFRCKPAINAKRPNKYFQFDFAENAVYCNPDEQMFQDGDFDYYQFFHVSTDELARFITSGSRTTNGTNRAAYSMGFAIIAAGPDRMFFTADDIVSW
jgi:prepilin-type N-terminal cleavage/methylation domain-containing protein